MEHDHCSAEARFKGLLPKQIKVLLKYDKDNSKNAAFTACTLSSFQDAELDYAFRYRGTQDNNWLMRFIGFDLLISNFEGGDIEYSMFINNLPWDSSYNMVYYLIDDKTHLEIIDNKEFDENNVNITKIIKSSSVHFLRLTNSSVIPKEGPPTASIPWFLQLKLLDPISKIFVDPISKIFAILLMLIFFT